MSFTTGIVHKEQRINSIQSKNTADSDLREQLHIEIENKTKICSNPTYHCSIPRIDGYEYCIRHILLDPRAPFKQCAYIYPTSNMKCTQAAPKHDIKKEAAVSSALTNYCFEHSRLVQLKKTHEIVGKFKQVETNEAYLNELTHHIKIDKQDAQINNLNDTDELIDVVSSNVEPFINYVHVAKFDANDDSKINKRRILDYASDSSSNEDNISINNIWKEEEDESSDDESIDSQNEDYLKHAGIYTTEEVALITKQKLIRLQSLYIDQIFRLQYLLKEKRRKYLQQIRKERETLCSIHDQEKDSAEERRLYEKLKALNHYHKRYGVEAILQKKYREKRLKANDVNVVPKGPLFTKCVFTEGGVKCGEKALPCSKYCKKHILEDKKQILFRACGVEKSGVVCQDPVPNIFEESTCVLHINFPNQKIYTQKKFDSETEEDDDETKKTSQLEIKDDNDDINMHSNNTENNNLNKSDSSNQHQDLTDNDDENKGDINIFDCNDIKESEEIIFLETEKQQENKNEKEVVI